jgi:hypothetical protein
MPPADTSPTDDVAAPGARAMHLAPACSEPTPAAVRAKSMRRDVRGQVRAEHPWTTVFWEWARTLRQLHVGRSSTLSCCKPAPVLIAPPLSRAHTPTSSRNTADHAAAVRLFTRGNSPATSDPKPVVHQAPDHLPAPPSIADSRQTDRSVRVDAVKARGCGELRRLVM